MFSADMMVCSVYRPLAVAKESLGCIRGSFSVASLSSIRKLSDNN